MTAQKVLEDLPGKKPGTPPGKQETVTVTCDGDTFTLERRPYSTEELLSAFKVAAGYLLNLKGEKGLDPLNARQHLAVKDGMTFFSQAPGGASS